MSESCNGWKNRQTWSCALWVQNDEGLYREALAYTRMRKSKGKPPTWRGFLQYAGLLGSRNPDGVAWNGSRLCLKELSQMLLDLDD